MMRSLSVLYRKGDGMNDAWKIDPDTKDLCFDDSGILEIVSEDETAVQRLRLTVMAF